MSERRVIINQIPLVLVMIMWPNNIHASWLPYIGFSLGISIQEASLNKPTHVIWYFAQNQSPGKFGGHMTNTDFSFHKFCDQSRFFSQYTLLMYYTAWAQGLMSSDPLPHLDHLENKIWIIWARVEIWIIQTICAPTIPPKVSSGCDIAICTIPCTIPWYSRPVPPMSDDWTTIKSTMAAFPPTSLTPSMKGTKKRDWAENCESDSQYFDPFSSDASAFYFSQHLIHTCLPFHNSVIS